MSLTTEDLNRISVMLDGFAMKADLQDVATKSDLTSMATKADLTSIATKADISGLATKTDLDRMEGRLVSSLGLLERDAFTRLDQHERCNDR
jgi:hypothetical protein